MGSTTAGGFCAELSQAPTLAYFNPNIADASSKGFGGCLMQENDGEHEIVGYTKQIDNLTPRLQRFRLRLMMYTYSVQYVPGKQLEIKRMIQFAKKLKLYCSLGWPDRKEIREYILPFMQYQNDIAYNNNSFLLKGSRLVIPSSLQLQVFQMYPCWSSGYC
ncbi:hypothetical protein PR048_016758 [Dryococelus australis]|uniref:Uncharacterized protein n=1 Tax=Dryococelus australis TaxID=614101 RepID=A0ABQ9H7K7_9NEOP|nr:hypothetical protein PR048_016758 [Dryococelus australis]